MQVCKLIKWAETFLKTPLLLVAIVFFAYFPTLSNDFCIDDVTIILTFDKCEAKLYRFFTDPILHGLTPHYRPLTFITFAFDFYLWKKNPFGYHLTNIFLAIICAKACFFFIKNFFETKKSFLISLFFSILPEHSEVFFNIFIEARQ